MFLRNDILKLLGSEEKTIRILWIDRDKDKAYFIDIYVGNALPEPISVEQLEADIDSKVCVFLEHDPFLQVYSEEFLASHAKRRDKAWSIIEPLVTREPNIYDASYRNTQIEILVKDKKLTKKTAYKWLRKYWQRGLSKNALLPDFDMCGAPGQERNSTEGVKRGRPRVYGDKTGINITLEIRSVFIVAVKRYYALNKKLSIRGSYNKMIGEFFCEKMVDPETGRIVHLYKDEVEVSGAPTYEQFYYWYHESCDVLGIKRKRLGARVYDKDLRGLLGTSAAETWGPGSRFQIDATIVDVYLVSRFDSGRIVGRPVLYIVIDVFSRVVVGFYIGFEGPSWVGAMSALANVVTDKRGFCKQYGIEITIDEWPCQFLPAVILGDKGEMEGRAVESLINMFNVTIENTASYRADWKGIVEQHFRLIQANFGPFVPGYVEPDFRERGATDYRLDAVLNIDDLTKIIIQCILYYNNTHEIKGYDFDQETLMDGVSPVPLDIWDWGIENRTGGLRSYPEEMVKFHLLPVDKAVVTLYGIRYKNLYYSCPKAIEEKWFDRARQNGSWSVTFSYDPRNLDSIYLHDSKELLGFQICCLTERSRAYRNMSLREILQQQKQNKDMSANHQGTQQRAKADLDVGIEGVVAEAAIRPSGVYGSNASRVRNIKENGRQEKESLAKEEAFRFDESTNRSNENRGKILAFPVQEKDPYAEPSISEIEAKNTREDDGE